MFTSTKDTTSENRKAEIKNYNLPILQEIYMGDRNKPLACCISNQPAFIEHPCLVHRHNSDKLRFTIDFNHIRQEQHGRAAAGQSLDKGPMDPSGIFRGHYLDRAKYLGSLIEFLTMMPVNSLIHDFITQDSQIGNITLQSFDPAHWPWHLQNKTNWDFLAYKYSFDFISYDQMIDHLSNIAHPPIANRLQMYQGGVYRPLFI